MLIFALSCMIHHRPLVFTVVFVLEKCIFCFSQQQQHISIVAVNIVHPKKAQNKIRLSLLRVEWLLSRLKTVALKGSPLRSLSGAIFTRV